MFDDLIIKETHTIRGKAFIFAEYGADKYLENLPDDSDTGELKGKKLAVHNIDFAAQVVSLSLAANSKLTFSEIRAEFIKAPRALQDELYEIAATLNGLKLVQDSTLGNESPGEDSPES